MFKHIYFFSNAHKCQAKKNKRAFTPKLTSELTEKHWKTKLYGIKPVYNNVYN